MSNVRLLMTRSAKARRSGILCCHFLRNLAFYESWFKAGQPFKDKQFWVTANGNFLDIAVLEWCKLFADAKAKHHFSKVLGNSDHFRADLLAELRLSEVEWEAYIEKFKAYRGHSPGFSRSRTHGLREVMEQSNQSMDTDILSAGFAVLLSSGQLRRQPSQVTQPRGMFAKHQSPLSKEKP